MPRGGARPGAGRPKGSRSAATKQEQARISDLAREHADTALTALVNIARDGESEAARVSAANAILDRAYGKPVQAMEHTGKDGGPIQSEDVTHDADAFARRMADLAARHHDGGAGAANAGSEGGA
jgi:hypothetical protein